jgi:hypothetical protein
MALKTVETGKVAVAPNAYWTVKPIAAAGTDIAPAIAAAILMEDYN